MGAERGLGRAVFASVLLVIGGILNVVYGIAAIGNSDFFVNNQHFILSNLKTWGWVTLLVGILELFAGFSVVRGGAYGRWFAILAASLAALAALFSIPAYPLWSIALFALSIYIIHGLSLFGEDTRAGEYAAGQR
jgi:hypothetical protein